MTKLCTDQLTDRIEHPGWEGNIAGKRCFYIRGATWFRNNVFGKVTNASKYSDDLQAHMKTYNPNWFVNGFQWDAKYNPRQFSDSLSPRQRRPSMFTKAVQTLALCDLIAKKRAEAGEIDEGLDVYSHMWIQPATYYVVDFSISVWNELRAREDNLLSDLRDHCGQISTIVFHDMAKGHGVTRKLAESTSNFLKTNMNPCPVGGVNYRWFKGFRPATEKELLADTDGSSSHDMNVASAE